MPLSPPRTLSPSKISSFTNCPLAFRLSNIDRLPDPSSPAAVKGTLVHSVLEALIWTHPPSERTRDVAGMELERAWTALQSDPEFDAFHLEEAEASDFRADADLLVDNYFSLEDPTRVRAVAVELGVEVDIGGMRLRGIIDRLDRTDDGTLVVIDYKSGKAPAPRFQQSGLTGVSVYSLLCEQLLGRVPTEVRLLYLRNSTVITAAPTQQSIQGQAQRATAVWSAIENACQKNDFRPRRSPLCGWCNFQSMCPEFGGRPPEPPGSSVPS